MIEKLITKLIVIFAIILVMVAADRFGLVSYLTRPFDRIKKHQAMLAAWFVFSTGLSGFFPNLICINVLAPVAAVYCQRRKINASAMMLALGFGVGVGNDISPLGGAGNLMAWGLVQKAAGYDPGFGLWFRVMGPATLLTIAVTFFWLWFLVFRKLEPVLEDMGPRETARIDTAFLLKTALVVIAVYSGLATNIPFYVPAIIAIVLFLWCGLKVENLRKLPLNVIYLYALAGIIGDIAGKAVIKYPVIKEMLLRDFSLADTFLISAGLAVLTNFISDGAITSALTPIILAANQGNLWFFAVVMKAIDTNFMTVVSDNSISISCGYGLTQKELLRVGTPIVITLIIARSFLFYLLKDSSWFIIP